MPATRTAARIAALALAGAVAAWTFATAASAGTPGEDDPKDFDELVARLRNPFLAKEADRDLQIVQVMLRQKSPKADACLRGLLADTGAHPTVVEQIVIATLIDPEHRLLPEVAERLRRESGSELDRALDTAFVTYGDTALVQRLAEMARSPTNAMPLRVEAVELLGRTGSPDALDPLLDLWGGPQKELREPAARAFDRILPAGAATRDEAAAIRESIRGVPFSEALRRLLRREGARPPNTPGRDVESDYVKLAAQVLPRATLQQVIESYLSSSVPAVRAMGARRLVDFPFDATDAPDARARAARECLAALHREEVEAVEIELLAALTARASELRGTLSDADLDALTERVRLTGRASNSVRLAAVRLVGELRDARAVPVMQETFANLRDGDVELRLALLDALQQAPGDMTSWLISRLAVETHTRVVRKLIVLLNRAEDPAAISAFGRLLASHPDQQVRWDVAKALGTLWAGRQLPAARDALLETGLADADATVRRTSAASLGSPGPGRDAIVQRLQQLLANEYDAKVKEAAAKSIMDLDEESAAKNLLPCVADDVEIWKLFRDHLVEDVRRRDKTPDRVLAAADVLAAGGQRRLAIDLLTQVTAAHDGLWESEGGRGAVLERLIALLLDQGDPDAARSVAQELLDATPRDAGPPRRRAELLFAQALCRSGRPDELREARRSLDALRFLEELSAGQRAEASVELGDCLLRMSDPLGAVKVLVPVAARNDLPEPLAKRAAALLDDGKRRAAEERKRIVAWVEAIDGPGGAEAQKSLREFGPLVAGHLLAALDETDDPVRVRRLLRAAALVAGGTFAQLKDDAPAADVAKATDDARAALRTLLEHAADTPNGGR
jgi:HEAT repeat protein